MKSIEIERHRASGICKGSNRPGVFVNRGLFRLQSSQSTMMPTVVGIVYLGDDVMFNCYHIWNGDPKFLLYCLSDGPRGVPVSPQYLIAR
eukprot:jgi/Phyca11/114188/e_gw1.25.572.1